MRTTEEQAACRIHFTDPDGQSQQSTVYTTWHNSQARQELLCGHDTPEAKEHGDALAKAMEMMFGRMGCQVRRIEMLSVSTRELL